MKQQNEKELTPITGFDFTDHTKQIDSPRSLEALNRLGVDQSDLYYVPLNEYLATHPETMNIDKECQEYRYKKLEEFRKKTIEEVTKLREQIIQEENEKENNGENMTGSNDNKENKNINNRYSSITPNETAKEGRNFSRTNPQQSTFITGMENESNSQQFFSTLYKTEMKEIEKIKLRQKNEIQSIIESEVKNELIRTKSEFKEKMLKEKENKIKEDFHRKMAIEDKKRKEKEIKRQNELDKKLEETERKNNLKYEAEQKRIEDFKLMQEKINQKKKKKQQDELKKLEERRNQIEKLLQDKENKQIEKEKDQLEKEKERKDKQEKLRQKKLKESELQKVEYEKKLEKNRLSQEMSLEKIRMELMEKQKNSEEKLNEILKKRDEDVKKQQQKSILKMKKIQEKIIINEEKEDQKNIDYQKRQDKLAATITLREQYKKELIQNRSKSYNNLFIKNTNSRNLQNKNYEIKQENIMKKMEEKDKKIDEGNKKKEHDLKFKSEDEFIRRFKKTQNILRLNRIKEFDHKKLTEELQYKDKKIEEKKEQKKLIMKTKLDMANELAKKRQDIVDKFERAMNKNRTGTLDPQIVKELFPEDTEFYNKIVSLTNELKTSKEKQGSSRRNSNIRSQSQTPIDNNKNDDKNNN